jgi:6-phosphogluconolactonase
MGDDGHTASLFPHTAGLAETEQWAIANVVPQLDTTRLTLTAPVINNARMVVFLIAGAGKADRLAEVIDGPDDLDRLPSQRIRPQNGRLIWLIDEAAAAHLAAIRG